MSCTIKHLFKNELLALNEFRFKHVKGTKSPKKNRNFFGISYGHIHHVDNTFGFDRRMPYATPLAGLYSCSAGCHPAGAVMGSAGHNCALRVLKDLGIS